MSFGGGGGGQQQDNSVELFKLEQQAAREADQRRLDQQKTERQEFEKRLSSSYSNALADSNQFFTSRGLDPTQYSGAITSAAKRARGNVPTGSETPGAFFDGIGQSVYDELTSANRNKYMRDINSFAGNDFATRRIDEDALDPTIDAFFQEQRGSADQYIKNLLDRGVITGSGYGAATRDLENQGYGAKAKLGDIGRGLIEGGRGDANEIANNARRAAQEYELGNQFDPFSYSSDLDSFFTDFLSNVGNDFRAQAPTSLFNTSGLPGIAGAAQGAGNTRFDPSALAGIFDEEDLLPTQPRAALSAF